GTAYKFLFPKKSEVDVDEAPFRLSALNPENTFVIYKNDSYKTPILGVKYVIKTDTNRKSNLELVAYTDTRCYRVESPFNFCLFDEKSTIKESVNGIGAIPIIEYPLNESRLGCFEIVIGLLDAINSTESNRMDGIEQFIQSFVKFTNCDIDSDSFRQLRSDGAIVIKGSPGLPADAQIMESSLDQQQAQTSANNLYQSVLTITGVPDREASAGGNTGQALIIGQGWASAEARAKATEAIFKKSERESLKVLLKIIKLTHKMPKELADLHLSDIDIKFTRNKTDNLLTKTQGLQNLVEVGVHPRIALSTVGLFSDPEQVYDDSKEYLSKWLTTQSSEAPNNQVTPSNNKPVPEDTE
ncbi:MAG: phage portal protein, partial [Eubacterium sp.]